MPLLDCINQISRYTICTSCGKPAGLLSYAVRYLKRVAPIAIILRKFSVSKHKSPTRLSKKNRNTAFGLLMQVRVLLTYHVVLDAMNEEFIVCKHVFDSLAVK